MEINFSKYEDDESTLPDESDTGVINAMKKKGISHSFLVEGSTNNIHPTIIDDNCSRCKIHIDGSPVYLPISICNGIYLFDPFPTCSLNCAFGKILEDCNISNLPERLDLFNNYKRTVFDFKDPVGYIPLSYLKSFSKQFGQLTDEEYKKKVQYTISTTKEFPHRFVNTWTENLNVLETIRSRNSQCQANIKVTPEQQENFEINMNQALEEYDRSGLSTRFPIIRNHLNKNTNQQSKSAPQKKTSQKTSSVVENPFMMFPPKNDAKKRKISKSEDIKNESMF